MTVRIDQTLSDRTRIFGRYSWHDQRLEEPNQYPALGNAPLRTRGQNIVLGMTNTLSSSLLHDVRFSYVPAVVDLQAYRRGRISTRAPACVASRRRLDLASEARSLISAGAAIRP